MKRPVWEVEASPARVDEKPEPVGSFCGLPIVLILFDGIRQVNSLNARDLDLERGRASPISRSNIRRSTSGGMLILHIALRARSDSGQPCVRRSCPGCRPRDGQQHDHREPCHALFQYRRSGSARGPLLPAAPGTLGPGGSPEADRTEKVFPPFLFWIAPLARACRRPWSARVLS